MAKTILIGIDEAGRGPLAGPVAVGAFAVNDKAVLKKFRSVKDSKQLTEKKREEWMMAIISGCFLGGDRRNRRQVSNEAKPNVRHFVAVRREPPMPHYAYSVSFSSARFIDKHGISKAIKVALAKCLAKLEKQGFADADVKILLDGSLKAPDKFKDQKTIIDGDAKEPIIALASICAKVYRDRYMKKLSRKYPDYGFEKHKGYGTEAHYGAIRKKGTCPEHRLTFL